MSESEKLRAACDTLRQEQDDEMAPMLLDGVDPMDAYFRALKIVRERRCKAAAERDAAIERVIAPAEPPEALGTPLA